MTRQGTSAKLSAVIPGASARTLIEAAEVAQRFGLDQLWVGDPAGGADDVSEDRYVTTTLGVLAAKTRELRLGGFLHKVVDPDGFTPAEMLHVAEDLSVVDQASTGRIEVAFVPGPTGWVEHVELVLSLWTDGWEVGDGRVIAVTPPPAQPTLPRLVVGADIDTAARLGAGRVVLAGDPADSGVRGRTVLLKPLSTTSVRRWLEDDLVGKLQALREEITGVRAGQVLFALGQDSIEEDLRALGTVVGPAVRCAKHDVARLAPDAWNWFAEGAQMSPEPPAFAERSDAFAAST